MHVLPKLDSLRPKAAQCGATRRVLWDDSMKEYYSIYHQSDPWDISLAIKREVTDGAPPTFFPIDSIKGAANPEIDDMK